LKSLNTKHLSECCTTNIVAHHLDQNSLLFFSLQLCENYAPTNMGIPKYPTGTNPVYQYPSYRPGTQRAIQYLTCWAGLEPVPSASLLSCSQMLIGQFSLGCVCCAVQGSRWKTSLRIGCIFFSEGRFLLGFVLTYKQCFLP